ncbi:MAG: four helix bundle protein [Bacteroidota bacterium]
MARVQRFEDLKVWQAARALVRGVYAATRKGAFARDFGLRDQIQRASVSVMSNIAEGFESRTDRLFLDYLGRAKASAGEVRSQLYIALDLEYIAKSQFQALRKDAEKVSKQLTAFMRYLSTDHDTRRVREDDILYDVETDE